HAGLRQAEMLDLAFADEVADRAGDILDRDARIDAVLVKQVDTLNAQTLQRAFGRLADMLRPAVHATAVLTRGGVDIETKLGCDQDLFAEGPQGLADNFLILERAIYFGGVEEADPTLERVT